MNGCGENPAALAREHLKYNEILISVNTLCMLKIILYISYSRITN